MDAESPDQVLRSFRKKPLFDAAELPVKWSYGKADVEKLLPHRDPLLLVDGLTGFDPERALIAGRRRLDPADPVFAGHFPGFPVYPGNLTVESIGQLGLCMHAFLSAKVTEIPAEPRPLAVRATKILGALFLEPLAPGDEVVLLAKRLSYDGSFGSVIGQALVRGKVAVVAIGEVLILE